MMAERGRAWFFLCLAVQGCIMAAASFAARAGSAPSTVVIALVLSFVPYAGIVAWSPGVGDKRVVDRLAVGAALVFGAALVLAPPVMSDDLYRYLWEGRLWLEGLNPYRVPPADLALEHLRTDLWEPINNKQLATIYPPLSQLLFTISAWLGGQIWTVKALALASHVASVVVVARLAEEPKAALAIALNPLLLSEAALNGHFDILTGVAILASAWALEHGRVARAAVATCAAVGLKAVGLVLLPLFARKPKALVGVCLVSGLLLLPLVGWRPLFDQTSGPGQFATRWRGNESIFALVDWLAHRLFADGSASLIARATVAVAIAVLWAVMLRRHLPPVDASRAAIWAVLLLSPQVHPWYLGWLLPLEVAARGWAGLIWSASVLCAYAPLDRWVREGVWEMPASLQLLSYSVVFIALIVDPHGPRLGATRRSP